MDFDTTVKKYRILDYSKLSDENLINRLDFFDKKLDDFKKSRFHHASIKNYFSIILNAYNIIDEITNRYPEFKDRIDFEGELRAIIKNNAINASKN